MRQAEFKILKLSLATLAVISLAGCAVGPAYERPETLLPESFDQTADTQEAGQNQNLLWSAFADPALNTLLDQAQDNNRSIAQASARLEEARAIKGLTIFSWFPTVTAQADRSKAGYSDQDPFVPASTASTDTYSAGLNASWEIDIFGSLRNRNEVVSSQERASEYLLDAVRLSVNAEVAQAYFSLRGAQEQLAIQTENVENLRSTNRILEALLREGRGTELELAQNRSLTLQVEAQIPNTEAEIVRQEQRLAVLTAQPLASVRELLATDNEMPSLPTLQTVGTPEDWIKRRPDVLAAEQQFVASNAQVGVNVADYFPSLNLVGNFGWTAQDFSSLGNQSSERWNYGPSISWNFLNLGRIRQNVRAAEAQADAAAAAYQEAVLLALEDAENALALYRASNQSQQHLLEAAEQSRKARDLAKLRYDNGAIDFLSLLDAERTLLTIENTMVQAKTAQATSLALVYKALAGDFAGATP